MMSGTKESEVSRAAQPRVSYRFRDSVSEFCVSDKCYIFSTP